MRTPLIGSLLLLGLLTPCVFAQVTLPKQQHGNVAAELTVAVLDSQSTPGLAHLRYKLTVTGGPLLEVEPSSLGDATAAWQVETNSWCRLEGDRLTLTEVLDLRQVKPGQVAPPSLGVRFRADAEKQWDQAEWVDILKPTLLLRPESVPELPGRTIPWRFWLTAATAFLVLILSVIGLLALNRPRKPAPPTPEQWALDELTRLETQVHGQPSEWYHTRLSYIVRRFLEQKHGLRAPRQTTAEFLQSVQDAPQLSDQQQRLLRQLLERCDLAKFAPVNVSQDDCRKATLLARDLVQEVAESVQGA
jgi:hypothetical protein